MDIAQKIDRIVQWLRTQGEQAGAKGMLVGISGGIDSAVVAHLIKRAYPENSLGVILPVHSSESQLVDAEELIRTCGINRMLVDLTQTHDSLLHSVQTEMGERYRDESSVITDANMRARLRMTTLYAIGNNLNYMVIGTDNAAEIYTGYYTKYGDGGVDLLPIAHLLKSEVYEWARELGVPDSIVQKTPSADLWEGQTDETEMGTTYANIDAHLSGKSIPNRDLEIIQRLHSRSEHKRNTPATPPKFD